VDDIAETEKNGIIKTKDIKKVLENYADVNHLPLFMCDYKIEEIETYIRDVSNHEFKQFNENISRRYENKEKISDEKVEFQQVFNISISKRRINPVELNYSLNLEESLTHPKLIIHPSSKIPYKSYKSKNIFLMLVEEVNKIKAEHGILVELFDDSMIRALKLFTKYIYAGKFIKNIKIPLFDGIEAELSRKGKLIMWFEEKEDTSQIAEVIENEVLVEYLKPIYGKSGLSCFGKQIENDFGENDEDLQLKIDLDSIEIVENEDRKLYKSKKKGFAHLVKDHLSVDNKITVEKISRVEKTFSKHEKNDIEVKVSQDNSDLDTVGEGVNLTSKVVHVKGHIGAYSEIKAETLRIDGATHKDSKQFAKTAQINRHKGVLKCNEAKITLLEGGEVHAKSVDIHSSLNGKVYAKDVTIGHVKNNLKVYASNSITVRVVVGEDNLFKINYKDVPIMNNQVKFINEEIKDLKYSLEEAKRHDESKIKEIESEIKTLKDKQKSIIESALNAKITIEQPFHGLNTINFTLDDGKELNFKTQRREYKPFHLEVSEDKITLQPVGVSIGI